MEILVLIKKSAWEVLLTLQLKVEYLCFLLAVVTLLPYLAIYSQFGYFHTKLGLKIWFVYFTLLATLKNYKNCLKLVKFVLAIAFSALVWTLLPFVRALMKIFWFFSNFATFSKFLENCCDAVEILIVGKLSLVRYFDSRSLNYIYLNNFDILNKVFYKNMK